MLRALNSNPKGTYRMKFIKDHGGRQKYFPCRFKKDNTNDCVIRAISIATDQDYMKVWRDLFRLGTEAGRMPNDTTCYEPYLTSLGWVKHSPLKKGKRKLKVKNFPIKNGAVIIHTCNHLTTILHGELHDTWNTGEYAANSYYTHISLN